MFEPYQLGHYNGNIGCWSDLVNPLQYGGDLLYNMSGGTYGMNTPAYFAYDDVAVQFE